MPANPTNADPKEKPRRRWLQFRLRTMLIALTLLSIPCAYVGWQAKIVAQRKSVLKNATEHGAIATTFGYGQDPDLAIPWIRRMMGDKPVNFLWWLGAKKEEREQFQSAFPETQLEDRW